MTKDQEMAELITDLLQGHYSALANRKHMNAREPELADHWGCQVEGSQVLIEIGGDVFTFEVKHGVV